MMHEQKKQMFDNIIVYTISLPLTQEFALL